MIFTCTISMENIIVVEIHRDGRGFYLGPLRPWEPSYHEAWRKAKNRKRRDRRKAAKQELADLKDKDPARWEVRYNAIVQRKAEKPERQARAAAAKKLADEQAAIRYAHFLEEQKQLREEMERRREEMERRREEMERRSAEEKKVRETAECKQILELWQQQEFPYHVWRDTATIEAEAFNPIEFGFIESEGDDEAESEGDDEAESEGDDEAQ